MAEAAKPIFLLADSQSLFARQGGEPAARGPSVMDHVRRVLTIEPAEVKAAYLGAANGDAPEFFELFQAAMSTIDIVDCRHVPAEPDEAALAFVAEADIVLLAGGDADVAWDAFEKAGLVDVLRAVPSRGAILMGVSAGAIQMGLSRLALLPYMVGAHAEPEWASLAAEIRDGGGLVVGLGIPTGAAIIAYPDGSIEPVRGPFAEIVLRGDEVRVNEVTTSPAASR